VNCECKGNESFSHIKVNMY